MNLGGVHIIIGAGIHSAKGRQSSLGVERLQPVSAYGRKQTQNKSETASGNAKIESTATTLYILQYDTAALLPLLPMRPCGVKVPGDK